MPSRKDDLSVPQLIAHKRDGHAFSTEQIRRLIEAYTDNRVADYQMSAWAMAVLLQGMTPKETAALTLAMRDSGKVVDLGGRAGRRIDKHSTGGVGDKVSICLAPIVAACGVKVPMVSGRGLGHTGGTLDKLEAIPGFRVDMPIPRFVKQVNDIGCALIGQTKDIAPADKKLYALRDVTATVESAPLITASILSKKLAEGIDGLVLDVKVGRGAFMKTLPEARELARMIVRVGRLAKKRVTAVLTAMDSPIGFTIGNALETREAIEILHGSGPDDLKEITFVLGAEMLRLASIASTGGAARRQMQRVIDNGDALKLMKAVVKRQGGDPKAVDEPDRLPKAPKKVTVMAPKSGFVHAIDSLVLGQLAVALGAGRTRTDQDVDPKVGIVLRAKRGDWVKSKEPLAELHLASAKGAASAKRKVLEAFQLKYKPPKLSPLVHDIIRR